MWLLNSHRAWNIEKGIFTGCEGKTFGNDEMLMFHPEHVMDEYMLKIRILKKLELTEEDIAMLTAITLMSTGRFYTH